MKHKRIVVFHYGGPEALQLVQEEPPEPRSDEVRVRVLAAGVAWGDVMKREGLGLGVRLPFTPGYDLVGIVDRLGANVSTAEVGRTVAALPLSGCYAELACVPASRLVPVPPGLDPAEAVCLVLNYVVAHQILHRAAQVKAGERLLVHSAAGGVGTALLQLGRLARLQLFGTASPGKHGLLDTLGATAIDYRSEDFVERILALTGDGVDVACDPIGGAHAGRSYRTLRRGGRLVVYGAHAILAEGKLKALAGLLTAPMLNLVPDGKTALSYNVTRPRYSRPAWCREDLARLLDLLAQAKITPLIAERIPLAQAPRAHQMLEAGAVAGKVVLVP